MSEATTNEAVELTSTIQYTNQDPSQVRELIEHDLPRFLDLFLTRSREYGDDNKFVLGSRGQFADMWRKFGKLKTGIWEGKEAQLTSEGVDEILVDLIGHCFLTLQCRRHEGIEGKGFRGEDVDTFQGEEPKKDLDVSTDYSYWSSEALFMELGRRHMSLPRAVVKTLTPGQVVAILKEGETKGDERDWDRIVGAERRAHDGQPNYELAGEDA